MRTLPDDWNELILNEIALTKLPWESFDALSEFIHMNPVEWERDEVTFTRTVRGPKAIINVIDLIARSLEMVDPTGVDDGTYVCVMWDQELMFWIEHRYTLDHTVRAVYTPHLPELCNYEVMSGLFPWEWPGYRGFHFDLVWSFGGLGIYYRSGL